MANLIRKNVEYKQLKQEFRLDGYSENINFLCIQALNSFGTPRRLGRFHSLE